MLYPPAVYAALDYESGYSAAARAELLRQRFPEITPSEIRAALRAGTASYGAASILDQVGWVDARQIPRAPRGLTVPPGYVTVGYTAELSTGPGGREKQLFDRLVIPAGLDREGVRRAILDRMYAIQRHDARFDYMRLDSFQLHFVFRG
jgi:hypothetical protein